MADSYITDNGLAVGNAGILIRPTGGATANVSVNRVQLENNTNGIFADGSGGGGATKISVTDSLLGGSSSNGIAVSSTGALFKALVSTRSESNRHGPVPAIRDRRMTHGNGTASTGGTLQSFKNNEIAANGVDGTPMTAFPGPGGLPLQ